MKPLPIESIMGDLKETVAAHSSVVVSAPPGAGKTTQVPLAMLGILPPGTGRIIMLEPRRIAAVSAARWMASLLGEEAGETVGYAIRFERKATERTRIEVVTEGILTRRIQNDPGLDNVAMVIFDEFHERSLHADLALALCLDLQRSIRPDLKILLMSATLDCAPISSLLGNSPVITSEGASFPVEVRYLPPERNVSMTDLIRHAVSRALREDKGDVLVFLPGSRDIRTCAETLEALPRRNSRFEVHPLFGDLPFADQERAILPTKMRKIVLATNIAETSLTIEGVGVVIDSGLTRRLRHDASAGMNRLITTRVSQASADQRKGRAGRLGPGVCYRLYREDDYRSFIPFAPPEISNTDLSSLLLELSIWGTRNPLELPWLDPPPAAALEAARETLLGIGAINRNGSVTSLGKDIARFPLHPRLAALVLKAAERGAGRLGADLASILSERDVLRRPVSRGKFDPDISLRLEALHAFREGKNVPDADIWALRTVDRVSRQISSVLSRSSALHTQSSADETMPARLLLASFPDRIAKRRDGSRDRFVLSSGRGVRIPADSHLGDSPFIVTPNVDAGQQKEGTVYSAAPVPESMIRTECREMISQARTVSWDQHAGRIVATQREQIGSLTLSEQPCSPSDDEALSVLCEAIRNNNPALITFSTNARNFQARTALMRKIFPEEQWPDLSDRFLFASPEKWLSPWLSNVRTAQDIKKIDSLQAMKALLPTKYLRLLDQRAPERIVIPTGRSVLLDYCSGEVPVLAVKLQEMFGCADTPVIAEGRLQVLLHLLSPAGRPVQVTRDLKEFWKTGYHLVRKELRGRYPKHPWPDDPWNAVPTRKTKKHQQ